MPGHLPATWSGTIDSAAAFHALAATPATADDLADAAQRHGGGGRLLRRRLARALIARRSGVTVDQVRLSRTAAGAPIVLAPAGWHIGQSGHGGDWLIGVARRPIAVDREPLDDAAPLRDMLTPAERAALDGVAEADQPFDWLRRWTIKEAHAKLIGDPSRIRPEAIETRFDSADEATATFEGVSRCWTRATATALETVAMWA